MPTFIYGTAWKEDDTERLTRLAIEAGFRAIDTANQRRHYFEAGVGAAVGKAIAAGLVRREDLFLQTKFTYAAGQDHRLPYERRADPATQVRQSLDSSLEHLQIDRVDSYLLHGPSQRHGLGAVDHEVWGAMGELVSTGKVRLLGISNASVRQVEELCTSAAVGPSFVQNRCFAATGWDAEVRSFCRSNGIVYQGFSLLTANARELRHPAILQLATRIRRTIPQLVFRFALQSGMLPLTGTTDPEHMRQDLAALDFELSEDDMRLIEAIGGPASGS